MNLLVRIHRLSYISFLGRVQCVHHPGIVSPSRSFCKSPSCVHRYQLKTQKELAKIIITQEKVSKRNAYNEIYNQNIHEQPIFRMFRRSPRCHKF